jgi:hypothetical protein
MLLLIIRDSLLVSEALLKWLKFSDNNFLKPKPQEKARPRRSAAVRITYGRCDKVESRRNHFDASEPFTREPNHAVNADARTSRHIKSNEGAKLSGALLHF